MANYFGYYGQSNGTILPAGGTVASATETVVASIPPPDNRQAVGLGVAVTGAVVVTGAASSTGTLIVRQTPAGSAGGTTGSIVGSVVFTVPATATTAQCSYPFIDNTGTYPVPGYSLNLKINSAVGTIAAPNGATILVQALGE
jgi:hypothetical protein